MNTKIEEAEHVHEANCNHGHDKLEPIVRTSPKVGRNDPCTCGRKRSL